MLVQYTVMLLLNRLYDISALTMRGVFPLYGSWGIPFLKMKVIDSENEISLLMTGGES